ncbi:MAG: hypothetical protein RSC25_07425 [Christensenella sp.]
MKLQKIVGFHRIYQAECFQDEFEMMIGKNKGESKRYLKWLYGWLTVLDEKGIDVLNLEQFEQLQNTNNPVLYAIRHPHSRINERYIYVYMDGESVVLLTAFKEKSAADYKNSISRATRIFSELEGNKNEY